MPKPNRYRGKNWQSEGRKHFDNNERVDNNNRRVSFKPHLNNADKQGKIKNKTKDWERVIRSLDEDIDMSNTAGFSGQVRYRQHNRKQGSARVAGKFNDVKRKLFEGPTNWYKILLPYGNKYDRDYIIKTLQTAISPLPLMPVCWKASGNVITFFVDDFKIADRLHHADRTITCPDGFKMIIKVHHNIPQVELTTQVKDAMKMAMANRYNVAVKALDLTKFHSDPLLSDYFCALFKPVIMLAAIDIMSENIPELEALNLQDNRIQLVDHMRDLKKRLPMLKILHLSNNKIRDITNLDALKGINIVELMLDNNPLCDKFKDRTLYVSEVRKRFPKVLKLDGMELPPPIGFDVIEDIPLPISGQTFLCLPEGQNIVKQFLEQYFQIYDSDSRQPLLQAYHANALFSMTMCYPYGSNSKNSSWLNWYQTDNRNLLRVQDSDRRNRLLRQGNGAVISFLSEMPKSKHDMNSFTVDLSIFLPQLIMLSATGVFRELESGQKTAPMRAFSRALVIVPAGPGFCIVNEHLHITNATDAQIKVAFKTPVVVPAPVPVAVPVMVPQIDDITKQQMVQTLSLQTGMNLDFSTKCLTETNWDFQKAIFIFSQLQKQGTIPPEAFVK